MQQRKYSAYSEYRKAQEDRAHTADDERCRFNYKLILHVLKTVTGRLPKKIFDIGCRDACWFDDYSKLGIECHGIDISQKSADYARGRGRNVQCIDVEDSVTPDGVDCVIMSHCIEHIRHPEEVLKRLAEETGGSSVMVVRCPTQDKGLRKDNVAHAWAWTLKEVCGLLSKSWSIRFYVQLRGEWFFILDKQPNPIDPMTMKSDLLMPLRVDDSKRMADLLSEVWLSEKINRIDRLKEKQWYINKYLPEIKKGEKLVLDIGCGPPEFLEWCRYYFNIGTGIDVEKSPMQGRYTEYSMLMHIRQNVNVLYVDFKKLFTDKDYFLGKFHIIHSQGSINQILKDDITWHTTHGGSWKTDKKTVDDFNSMFDWFRRSLYSGGKVMIYANGSLNDREYSKLVNDAAIKNGFKNILQHRYIMHKFQRIDR